jgi:hypothetical protein
VVTGLQGDSDQVVEDEVEPFISVGEVFFSQVMGLLVVIFGLR